MAYKQKEYREKMKRDGSGMEQKTYILLNAGGTEINGTDQSRGNEFLYLFFSHLSANYYLHADCSFHATLYHIKRCTDLQLPVH